MNNSKWTVLVIGLLGCGGAQEPEVKPQIASSAPTSTTSTTESPSSLLPCGTSGLDELASLMVESLSSGDAKPLSCAYVLLTKDPTNGGCFDAEQSAVLRTSKFSAFLDDTKERCSKSLGGVDWASSTIASHTGGELKSKDVICGLEVEWREDLHVVLKTSNGEKSIVIDDIVSIEGRLGLTADMMFCGSSKDGAPVEL